ncbi:hypothetical protein NLJ89_g5889 [Agrocybe chaxingu]|uniref:HNH nuclease domain-containing protein n=1 Tax=Agrocybe chaxingu TaxID=84603 RepID=A0A9W8MT80_9AGAR|nr:hypothetical protein NLJ89_g5889 [Agrocybe chaxingu]
MATLLPLEVPERVGHVEHVVSAYNICLHNEKEIMDNVAQRPPEELKKADTGLKTVVQEISSCTDIESFLALGQSYLDHYVRAFLCPKGRTPIPSRHPSRPSFDRISDMIRETLQEAPENHSAAKRNALIRDRYRCVISGVIDRNSARNIQELMDMLTSEENAKGDLTQCAHIFSESTNTKTLPDSKKERYAASVWAVMSSFGCEHIPAELNGAKVHRLENVMTLIPSLHEMFDTLKLWFIHKAGNTYRIETPERERVFVREYPKEITFTSTMPEKLPVPSREYLAIHAACAKVAHLSGAAEYIDQLYRDMEDMKTLATDGSSADTLEQAISDRICRKIIP